jgi:hypothetical protein
MSGTILQEFRRYASLIEAAMGSPGERSWVATAEGAGAVQVERGALCATAMLGGPTVEAVAQVGPLVQVAAGGVPPELAVVDARGHRRPVYRPLLVYGWLQAFRSWYELLPRADFVRWDEALRAWCDLLEADLGSHEPGDTGTDAARGDAVAESAWSALALFAAGRLFVRDAWTDLASDAFGRLTRGQTPAGTFLTPGPSDNPETWWYHELVLLHAAASYAVQAEDRTAASAVAKATDFHLRETQPDHATSQPWGLFAFVWNERTRPVADQLLHAAAVNRPAGADGVSLILLADALYCLRLFDPARAVAAPGGPPYQGKQP